MSGGAGDDTYVIDAGDVINEAGDAGTDEVRTALTTYVLGNNIENLLFTGTTASTGTGNALHNRLVGTVGVDTLVGAEGDDTLDGSAGGDSLEGGAGNDTYVVDSLVDMLADLAGIDTVQTSIDGYTLAAEFENLTLTVGAVNGTGNALDNVLTGNSADNTLDGNAGNDTMAGGAGNDIYVVQQAGDVVTEELGAGTDTVQSALSSYTLSANVENLVLIAGGVSGSGNELDNVLTGNSAANVLDGGAGGDTLVGGAGNDTLYGGLGNDTYSVDSLGDVVTEASEAGTDTVQTALSAYTLGVNVENLVLVTGGLNGSGNALDNVLTGNAAANVLIGWGGNDTMAGGAGNDIYVVQQAGDVVNEDLNAGTDTVQSALQSYTLSANVENLVLISGGVDGTGNELNNVLTGNAAANVLNGGEGNDTMTGGAGNDTYNVDSAGDAVIEGSGAGRDTVQSALSSYTLGTNVENLVLATGGMNGSGNALDNALTGNAAANVLIGWGGNDTMAGGAGNDIYVVQQAGDVVTEELGAGTDTVQSALSSYTLSANVENLVLIAGGVSGSGNELDNVLTGNSAANVLDGGAGGDTLVGGAGNDTLYGGLGNDTYSVDSLGDVVTEASEAGTDTVQTALSAYTLGVNVENLVLVTGGLNGSGNALDNVLTGNAAANVLIGWGGNDTMAGGAGNDIYVVQQAGDVVNEDLNAGTDTVQSALQSYTLSANVENLVLISGGVDGTGNELNNVLTGNAAANVLNGGEGNDTMTGGAGNDTYNVDSAGDAVIEGSGAGRDTVQSALSSYTLGTNVENLVLATGGMNGSGNALDNALTGNAAANVLIGWGGNDTMAGGAGNDIYVVQQAGDVVTEELGAGTDTVQSALSSYTLSANVENLVLIAGGVSGSGNELDNVLTGNSAANVLDGGEGSDTLIGGAGSDTFVFSSVSGVGNIDTIRDFVSGSDKLTFDDAIYNSLGEVGVLDETQLSVGAGLTTSTGTEHLVFDTSTGTLYFDADGAGDQSAVQVATLVGVSTLSVSDIFVV
jgi:Ca2+-binding RTX toxin-like protein